MTCFHPIKAFIVDEAGTDRKFHFASVDTDKIVYNHQVIENYVLLPCGKCIGCQVDRSRDWANRMMLELTYHETASFITLTYANENLPMSWYVDENGEVQEIATLRKEDFQLFMKRLRKQIAPKKIRFFACGEYGDKTKRPHYHAIIFGYDFPDKKEFSRNKGYINYRSELLENVWSYGHSLINEVNWNTCAYVSRYCTKKMTPVRNIYYQTFNIEPEFNLMSRRPGIGRQWYEDHKSEVYIKSDDGQIPFNTEIHLSNNKGGLTVSPPKYYDRLYSEDDPCHMEEIKQHRKEIGEQNIKNKLEETDLELAEYLKVREENFKARIKTLRRDKI